MATKLATPGVYVEEKSSFGNTVVSVPTAVPAFVGYTEKASNSTKDLTNVPTRITSFSEYNDLFGGPSKTKFEITNDEDSSFNLKMVKSTRFLMYDSLRLFFNNGGSECYIVSTGSYSSGLNAKKISDKKIKWRNCCIRKAFRTYNFGSS
jgi:phage tail sheath protein FI